MASLYQFGNVGSRILYKPRIIRLSARELFGLPPIVNKSLTSSDKFRPTYYDILGIDHSASTTEIRDSFIRLSKEYHPDTTKKYAGNHNRFVVLNEAYSTLSKPCSRQCYDLALAANQLNNLHRSAHMPYGGSSSYNHYPHSDRYSRNSRSSSTNTHRDNSHGSSQTTGYNEKTRSDMIASVISGNIAIITAALAIVAFIILSNSDPVDDIIYHRSKSGQSRTDVIPKETLEKEKLLMMSAHEGKPVFYFAVPVEVGSDDQKVVVACREGDTNGADYHYRILSMYNALPKKRK